MEGLDAIVYNDDKIVRYCYYNNVYYFCEITTFASSQFAVSKQQRI